MNDPDGVQVGDDIPSWTMESVDPARMRTMAAILRDPYPVHWDRDGNAAIGLPGRVINQGPLNLGYVVNMLLAWAGPTCVRRLSVSFGRPVLDGDRVTAGGRVTDVSITDDERRATCDVWLDRDGEHVVTGTAVVALGPARSDRGHGQSQD
jgi:acyl dehydratase